MKSEIIATLINKVITDILAMPQKIKQLVQKGYGDPSQVLAVEEATIHPEHLKDNEVFLKWLAAPINPSDLATLMGVYGDKQALPAVGGKEGSALVQAVGSNVTTVKVGDQVICKPSSTFTWCTHSICEEQCLMVLDKIDPLSAATLAINPPTAYGLLKEYVALKEGDTIVQNGANSAVGKYVIQMCKMWGINSVNVVRSRPDIETLKAELQAMGATEVVTQEEFQATVSSRKGILLALDCIGGASGSALLSSLDRNGHFVSYGVMSGQAVEVSPFNLIFKNVAIHGFWLGKWPVNRHQETSEVYGQLIKWIKEGKLHVPPFKQYKIEDFAKAIKASVASTNSKQLFVF